MVIHYVFVFYEHSGNKEMPLSILLFTEYSVTGFMFNKLLYFYLDSKHNTFGDIKDKSHENCCKTKI